MNIVEQLKAAEQRIEELTAENESLKAKLNAPEATQLAENKTGTTAAAEPEQTGLARTAAVFARQSNGGAK